LDEDEQKEKYEQNKLKLKRQSLFNLSEEAEMYQYILPNAHYRQYPMCDSRVYGGRFTSRGNLYYCSSQEAITIFNTYDPYNWKKKASIQAMGV